MPQVVPPPPCPRPARFGRLARLTRLRRPAAIPLALFVALAVAGCPRRFDPRAQEIRSSDPAAEAAFQDALRLVQKGELPAADRALEEFRATHRPPEPLLPLATVMQARVARLLGQPARARELLQPLAQPGAAPSINLEERARLELGLAEHALGHGAAAQALLAPLSSLIVESEEATELHAALADLLLHSDDRSGALREYELFYRGVGVRPLEQAWVRAQVGRILPKLPVGERERVRQRFGIEAATAAESAPAQASAPVVGLLVPLSGKNRTLGERVLRGALWSAELLGAPHRSGPSGGVDLRVRDSAAADAGAAIAELQREGAQSIIGSPVKQEAGAIAAAAERAGLLAVHLSAAASSSPTSGRSLTLLRSNPARAQALARELVRSGLPSVMILAPATPYGQAMTRAFVDALASSPVKVLAELTFSDSSTTFTAQAQQVVQAQPSALFVPASAAQLELIASQLATAGALPTWKVTRAAADKPALASPPVKLLLSTAEGLGERLLKSAGRYLQGAVLAPVSLGGLALSEPGAGSRWDGFQQQLGAEPGALDAMGFDAVQLVRAACEKARATSAGAACTADELGAAVRGLSIEGATGTLSFDASGQRSDTPLLVRIHEGGVQRVR
ncbi:MAG: penicillin-binding protein activator [Polyangia bacterium]